MSTPRLDTYCGLYCGACEIVHARTDQDKARLTREFQASIPGWDVAPEELRCSGCKTDDVFVNCRKCRIRPCAEKRGVAFCMECGEFPCELYRPLLAAAKDVPGLKHLRAITANQEFIRREGVKSWLESQKGRWACPDCGAPFAWYTKECARCGRSLVGIKDYETLED